ncbi:acetylxylan esterase [Phytomonospora endophytica]|uniref:Cephalosporin-C deacetylase n=1 Tax=Phytomonospora endophytica TaxID=714109 RepID=A0A841FR79_9ACTN|nr:acetylxylan esterase [Phytomonospora endophytica]MBB6035787.1 cephalosporin-C deacetylase [Phytomonospora endophytica]GIG69542.1 deacetylase [Phytomonospora endophytica]
MVFAHDYPFDPAYGYDLDELLKVGAPEGPADFDDFWRGLFAAASAVDVTPELGPVEEERDGVRVHPVSFASVGGVRIGGWLTLPADGKVERGAVAGHGYGGRGDADTLLPLPRTAAIFPCLRGMGERGRVPGIPDVAAGHVLHGIESRESYVHGGCAADVWCAATALNSLIPETAGPLAYLGSSFGGGIGALALPWDERFAAAHLEVPSFGNHPLRVTLPCVGSGDAISGRYRERPEVLDVLAYFDAATAARRIEIPVQVGAALFDPAVPPPGQFAVYNALGGDKRLHVLRAGHFAYRGDAAAGRELVEAQRGFFGEVWG